jgi:dienelactone hydrolase
MGPSSGDVRATCGRGIPTGPARLEVDVGDGHMTVFTYRPLNCRDAPLLLVFHGMRRNADEYRDHARGLADRCRMLVMAPLFESPWSGRQQYQKGGLVRGGRVTPPASWTWSVVPRLVDHVRKLEGRPGLPCFLLGHSAGGQFLLRMGAFVTTDAERIVVANPGSLLFPTRDLPYPYGFGGLPGWLVTDQLLQSYLRRPLTLYLGTADTARDEELDTRPDADRQGHHRLERGRNAFRAAEQLAGRRGWHLGWRLVEAPGVGHDHEAVFDSPACRDALIGSSQSA